MAKTAITIDEKTIVDNIDGERLKEAFRTACAVARGERGHGALEAAADDVHDLQVFADRLGDLHDAICTAIKNAEGVRFRETGSVTKGFRLKNTGSTVTVTDTDGLISEAVLLGYNEAELRKRLTISAKDAKAAMGIDDDRFRAEFADFVEIKKKSDTLVREY